MENTDCSESGKMIEDEVKELLDKKEKLKAERILEKERQRKKEIARNKAEQKKLNEKIGQLYLKQLSQKQKQSEKHE